MNTFWTYTILSEMLRGHDGLASALPTALYSTPEAAHAALNKVLSELNDDEAIEVVFDGRHGRVLTADLGGIVVMLWSLDVEG